MKTSKTGSQGDKPMNATYTYKSYQVQVVGLSHYIYAPGETLPNYYERGKGAIGHAISKAEAKRWITQRIEQQKAASILGRKGGSATSEKKTISSRENGRKGGRPRKETEKGDRERRE